MPGPWISNPVTRIKILIDRGSDSFREVLIVISPGTGASLAPDSGSWSTLSDRNAKINLQAIAPQAILARLAGVPIARWSYTAQGSAVTHIGPMAQDFYAAFGIGEDDKHISTVDADGVALASIQGLYRLVQEKDAEIISLKERVATLEQSAPGAGPALPIWLLALAAGTLLALLGVAVVGMLVLARWLRRTEAL